MVILRMNILVLNCGSSSIKFQLINMDDESVVAKGQIERIGAKDAIFKYKSAVLLIHYYIKKME